MFLMPALGGKEHGLRSHLRERLWLSAPRIREVGSESLRFRESPRESQRVLGMPPTVARTKWGTFCHVLGAHMAISIKTDRPGKKRSSSESKKKASTKRQEEDPRGNTANGREFLELVSE